MAADPFDSALDLLRRLPPGKTAQNLEAICKLAPSLTEDLLSSVDQPLEVRRCKKSGRDYLLCDYNRDGDSWRSPWSNTYEPPLDDEDSATKPSDRIRSMEVKANEGFDVYRDLYYEGGTSSVYLWDLDDGFAGVVLLKKGVEAQRDQGVWDSIHVFEALDKGRTTQYKLTSTIILQLVAAGDALGSLDLSGNLTRQQQSEALAENDTAHVANLGRLVEDMELKMRNLLQEVYFGKAKDVVGDLRSMSKLSDTNKERAARRDVISSMAR